MNFHQQRLRRVAGISLLMLASASFVIALLWSTALEHFFHSQAALLLVAVLFAGFGLALHPALRAGVANALREFRESSTQVADEINHGDDDGFNAA